MILSLRLQSFWSIKNAKDVLNRNMTIHSLKAENPDNCRQISAPTEVVVNDIHLIEAIQHA